MREDQLVVLLLGLFSALLCLTFLLLTKHFEPSTYVQWFDFKRKKKVFYNNRDQEIQVLPGRYIHVHPKKLQAILVRVLMTLMALSVVVPALYIFWRR